MSTISLSNIPSGNGTDDNSNNGNFLTKVGSYLPAFVTRCFGLAPNMKHPNLEAVDGHDIEGAQGTGGNQSEFIEFSPNTHGNMSSGIQLQEIITENRTTVRHQEVNGTTGAGNSIINGSANENTLLMLQKMGIKVVKYLVMPTSMVVAPNAMGTAVNLFQVFTTKKSAAASAQTFLLKPLFGSAIVNVFLGVILFMLSTSKGNFLGKVFILRMTILLTTASTIGEIGLLFAVGWQFVSLV